MVRDTCLIFQKMFALILAEEVWQEIGVWRAIPMFFYLATQRVSKTLYKMLYVKEQKSASVVINSWVTQNDFGYEYSAEIGNLAWHLFLTLTFQSKIGYIKKLLRITWPVNIFSHVQAKQCCILVKFRLPTLQYLYSLHCPFIYLLTLSENVSGIITIHVFLCLCSGFHGSPEKNGRNCTKGEESKAKTSRTNLEKFTT